MPFVVTEAPVSWWIFQIRTVCKISIRFDVETPAYLLLRGAFGEHVSVSNVVDFDVVRKLGVMRILFVFIDGSDSTAGRRSSELCGNLGGNGGLQESAHQLRVLTTRCRLVENAPLPPPRLRQLFHHQSWQAWWATRRHH